MEISLSHDVSFGIKGSDVLFCFNSNKVKKDISANIFSYPLEVKGWGNPFDDVSLSIYGPGEYEVNGAHVYGYGFETTIAKKTVCSTTYFLRVDGVRVLVLSSGVTKKGLSEKLSEISEVDVIIFPCGEVVYECLSPQEISSISSIYGASVLVAIGNDKNFYKELEKEFGKVEISKKVNVKQKDLTPDFFKVVVSE